MKEQIENAILQRRFWTGEPHIRRTIAKVNEGESPNSERVRNEVRKMFTKVDNPKDIQPNVRLSSKRKILNTDIPDRTDKVVLNNFFDIGEKIQALKNGTTQDQYDARQLEILQEFISWNFGPVPGGKGMKELYAFINEDALKPDSGIPNSDIMKLLRITAQRFGNPAFILPGTLKLTTTTTDCKVIPFLNAGFQVVRFMDNVLQAEEIAQIIDQQNPNTFGIRDDLDLSNLSQTYRLTNGRQGGAEFHLVDRLYASRDKNKYEDNIGQVLRNVPDSDIDRSLTGYEPPKPCKQLMTVNDVFELLAQSNVPGHVESLINNQEWTFIPSSDGQQLPELILMSGRKDDDSGISLLDPTRVALDEAQDRLKNYVTVREATREERTSAREGELLPA